MSRHERWVGAGLVVLAACGGPTDSVEPPPPPPPVVAAVEVTPDAAAVSVGQTVALGAAARTAAGVSVSGRITAWASRNEGVATVSTAGLVTAVSPGLAHIVATIDGVTDSAAVTVVPAFAASCRNCLEVVPASVLVVPPGGGRTGTTEQLTVFRVDGSGGRSIVAATFESSAPGVVAVTGSGRVTGVAFGAAQIVARAQGLASAPVFALAAAPTAGATLVGDAQVVSRPVPVDSAAPYQLGYRTRTRLRGVVPTAGQILVGTGALPLGGRVVSAAAQPDGTTDVVLALVPLDEMFTELTFSQRIPLDQAPTVVSDAAAAAFSIDTLPGGGYRYRARLALTMSAVRPTGASRPTPVPGSAVAPNEFEFDLGGFSCKAVVEGSLVFPLVLDGLSFELNPSLIVDLVVVDLALQRLVVTGEISPRLTSKLTLNAGVKGSVECKMEVATVIVPIGGPLASFVGGQIPLGVGFGIEAKAEVPGFGYDALFQATVTATFGLDCAGGCHSVGNLDAVSSGFFKPAVPSLGSDVRIEGAAGLFGYAELQLGNPLFEALQFKVLTLKAGLEQKADLASQQFQADDPSYASTFRFGPAIEAKTASSLTAFGGLLGIEFASLSYAPTLPPLATSPAGTLAISPSVVQAGSDTALGDLATFTVTLDPVTYLGDYVVDGVEIRWLRDDGTGTMVLQPARPACTSLTPATTGQTVFSCETDFPAADAGATHRFHAFVRARLFGIPMPLLEIAGNGSATLTVTPPGPPPPPPPPDCVGVDFDIDNQADLAAAAGLSCVDRLSIFPVDSAVAITLPALQSARFILISSRVESFSARALRRVGSLVAHGTKLAVLDIPVVEEAGVDLAGNAELTELDFSALKRITGRTWAVRDHPKLETLNLPCSVDSPFGTSVHISNNAKLSNGALRAKMACWGIPADRFNITGNGLP